VRQGRRGLPAGRLVSGNVSTGGNHLQDVAQLVGNLGRDFPDDREPFPRFFVSRGHRSNVPPP
jgi:hypothetical protein